MMHLTIFSMLVALSAALPLEHVPGIQGSTAASSSRMLIEESKLSASPSGRAIPDSSGADETQLSSIPSPAEGIVSENKKSDGTSKSTATSSASDGATSELFGVDSLSIPPPPPSSSHDDGDAYDFTYELSLGATLIGG